MTGAHHAQGHNHESVAICLVGGLDSDSDPCDNFTRLQKAHVEVSGRRLPAALAGGGGKGTLPPE